MPDNNDSESRRKLLKSIAAGTTGALIAGKTLPESWMKPVVDSVMLPAHAQTSCSSTNTFVITTPSQVGPPVVVPDGGSIAGGAGFTITGSITPNPGVISVTIAAFVDGSFTDSIVIVTDASGNYSQTAGPIPTNPPNSIVQLTTTAAAPFACATATWTATILGN